MRVFLDGIRIDLDLTCPRWLRFRSEADDIVRAVEIVSRDSGIMALCDEIAAVIVDGSPVIRARIRVERDMTMEDVMAIRAHAVNAIIDELFPGARDNSPNP